LAWSKTPNLSQSRQATVKAMAFFVSVKVSLPAVIGDFYIKVGRPQKTPKGHPKSLLSLWQVAYCPYGKWHIKHNLRGTIYIDKKGKGGKISQILERQGKDNFGFATFFRQICHIF